MRKLTIVALALGLVACGEGEEDVFDEIEDRQDCREACTEWQACMGDDVDVSGCTDSCEDAVDSGELPAAVVEDCSDCLDAADGSNQCSATCAGECEGLFYDANASMEG